MSNYSLPPNADGRQFARMTLLDGQGLKELILAGLLWLKTNQQTVNALNVFPVPDGDTGTNMVLTMQAAYAEVANSGERNAGKLAHALAQGALMGARGNSGVILSQLFRGFARAFDSLEEVDATTIVKALVEAKNTAYKGVVRPVEGTILTVAKDIALAAEALIQQNEEPGDLLQRIVTAADASVQHTPELLPILKQAGVVDSGGKGLFFILEGMLRYINGLSLDTALTVVQPLATMQIENAIEQIEEGQDFEVVVDFQPKSELNLEAFYQDLGQMGTSIQIGEGDGMYRMHIHVPLDKRYTPIDYIMGIGTVTKIAMENLVAQMEDRSNHSTPTLPLISPQPDQIAVIAVSPGWGISRIFASLGAAAVVQGGQTMNPSTEEILHAFEHLPTDKIVILPDNKNIIMAAQSAATMTAKRVAVIPTRSVPQGLNAMLRVNPEGDFDRVVKDMTMAIQEVDTGEITTATRTVEIDGVPVQEGQIIALLNGKVVLAAANLGEAVLGFLKKAQAGSRERITIFYGENISKNEVSQIAEMIQSAYPEHEVELHEGGQPHYHFIIAIE